MTAQRTPTPIRLSRETFGARPPAEVRILHLGLGNFFRAHQAWYTEQAPDAHDWGIAAFTGRSPDVADALGPQDGLYTLITCGPDRDQADVISSVVAVHSAGDHAAWLDYFRSPRLAIVTVTVTEAAYTRGPDTADIATLRRDSSAPVASLAARLLAGLIARDRAGLGPVAIVPCDNLPGNGDVAARIVRDLATLVDPSLAPVIDRTARFVITMVDRITPRATDDDARIAVGATGLADAAPVVTEPFSEWVLSGEFPAGRPRWDDVGAVFTDDVTPFEERKLRLLNGGHSLLAYAASIRGHRTVAEACADETCRAWLHQWWDEASRHIAAPALGAYRAALLDRFANPRMRHRLDQIAADGSQKLPVRILPVLRAERAAGRIPVASARVLAAWVCHLRGHGAAVSDPVAETARGLAAGPVADAVPRLLHLLDVDVARDSTVIAQVVRQAGQFEKEIP